MLNISTEIKENSVDLLLTDPPYNISSVGAAPTWIDPVTGKDKNGIHNQKFSESFEHKWDDVEHNDFLVQIEQWSKIWIKVLRPGGSFAIFISDRYISYLWTSLESVGLEPKRVWTWKKPAAVPFNRKVNPVSACEYIITGIKPGKKRTFNSDVPYHSMIDRYAIADKISSIVYKLIRQNSYSNLDEIFNKAKKEAEFVISSRKNNGEIVECVIPNTIQYSGGLGKKIHPTEKPVEVLKYFIELLSNPGDLVVDTFAGSGSTGVAARELERRSVLIERDVKMYKLMCDKLINTSSIFDNL